MDDDLRAINKLPYERRWARNDKVKAIIAMIHPMAVIIFSLLSGILAVITLSGIPDLALLIALVLAMAAAQSSIGVFNEFFDWKLDKENKPWRAIPAGMISPGTAAAMATMLLFLGLAIAASISLSTMSLLFVLAGVGILYSAGLKRTVFSWLPYAIDYPSIPVWVMVALDQFDPRILVIYLLALPFVIAVHVCNQLRDFEGDSVLGVRGLVQGLGWKRSVYACLVLLFLSPLPFLTMIANSSQQLGLMIMIPISILHWALITMPVFWKDRDSIGPASFRLLFRQVQISGPLMLVIWYWLFVRGSG